jgi:hypothetical protein
MVSPAVTNHGSPEMHARTVRWANIAIISLSLALLGSLALWVPGAFIEREHAAADRSEARPATLQELIESGHARPEEISPQRLEALFPFESISLERTPCYGGCPVYTVTFRRDGSATVERDDWQRRQRETYAGTIGRRDFARLTQLVQAAREVARDRRYRARWTDDYSANIRAESKDSTWEVSDYGEVSPPQVWALATILDAMKEQTAWTLIRRVPMDPQDAP